MPVRKDPRAAHTLHHAIHQFLDCLFRPDLIIQTASLPTLRRHLLPFSTDYQRKFFDFTISSTRRGMTVSLPLNLTRVARRSDDPNGVEENSPGQAIQRAPPWVNRLPDIIPPSQARIAHGRGPGGGSEGTRCNFTHMQLLLHFTP